MSGFGRCPLQTPNSPGELWTFEQKQGILYIHVPIRMTVYRMQTRPGLFVYAPVAPTDECVRLLRELEEQHGEVAYIVLPTVAVEHKYFVGPFSQAFPKAEVRGIHEQIEIFSLWHFQCRPHQVWVCPGQFSVPLQLPLPLLGFPWDARLRTLPKDTSALPQCHRSCQWRPKTSDSALRCASRSRGSDLPEDWQKEGWAAQMLLDVSGAGLKPDKA